MVTHELSLWKALGLILGRTMLLHLPRLDKQNPLLCLQAPSLSLGSAAGH